MHGRADQQVQKAHSAQDDQVVQRAELEGGYGCIWGTRPTTERDTGAECPSAKGWRMPGQVGRGGQGPLMPGRPSAQPSAWARSCGRFGAIFTYLGLAAPRTT